MFAASNESKLFDKPLAYSHPSQDHDPNPTSFWRYELADKTISVGSNIAVFVCPLSPVPKVHQWWLKIAAARDYRVG